MPPSMCRVTTSHGVEDVAEGITHLEAFFWVLLEMFLFGGVRNPPSGTPPRLCAPNTWGALDQPLANIGRSRPNFGQDLGREVGPGLDRHPPTLGRNWPNSGAGTRPQHQGRPRLESTEFGLA